MRILATVVGLALLAVAEHAHAADETIIVECIGTMHSGDVKDATDTKTPLKEREDNVIIVLEMTTKGGARDRSRYGQFGTSSCSFDLRELSCGLLFPMRMDIGGRRASELNINRYDGTIIARTYIEHPNLGARGYSYKGVCKKRDRAELF